MFACNVGEAQLKSVWGPMPVTLFLVRAVVAPNLRGKFDHLYMVDHLS